MWQAAGVDPWTVGAVAIMVVALLAIIYGALADRAKNRRLATQIMSPPERTIPQFAPDSPAPTYLSELQARRRPESTSPASATDTTEIAAALRDSSTVTLDAGFTSADFVTDPTARWAVLDSPRVLVCAEPVEAIRELLPVLERAIRTAQPLVVVAPAFAAAVSATLEVNQVQGKLAVCAVKAAGPVLYDAARATGAVPIARSDLQAGYAPPEQLGSCVRWVSTSDRSYVIAGAGGGRR